MAKPPPDKKSSPRPGKTQPAPKPVRIPQPPRVAFPKKNQQPTPAAFTARLPLALGKRFEAARTFLLKQKEVVEDVYFYGPSTGWALRYLCGGKPLCSLLLHSDCPVAIVLWLDIPLAGTGAADFKMIVRGKLATMAP